MNEDTSSNKITGLALVLAILLALIAGLAAGVSFRQSHRLQVRLDATTKELHQAQSDLKRVRGESEKAAGDLAKIQQRSAGLTELENARLKLANMMAHGLAQDHPAVRELTSKISELQK